MADALAQLRREEAARRLTQAHLGQAADRKRSSHAQRTTGVTPKLKKSFKKASTGPRPGQEQYIPVPGPGRPKGKFSGNLKEHILDALANSVENGDAVDYLICPGSAGEPLAVHVPGGSTRSGWRTDHRASKPEDRSPKCKEPAHTPIARGQRARRLRGCHRMHRL